uniref:GPCR family 3 nine cysteines domain-containing protein n=1 Tax=Sus scrofa TaxID=9823 RepID=A0A4X1VPU8_PIG
PCQRLIDHRCQGLGLKIKVGEYSPHAPCGQELSLSEEMLEWAAGITETPCTVCSESCGPGFRKSLLEGKSICCFSCTPCPENEISSETGEKHITNPYYNHCCFPVMCNLLSACALPIRLHCGTDSNGQSHSEVSSWTGLKSAIKYNL